MSPEDQALAKRAGEAESAAANEVLTQYLQGRVVDLRMEVLKRDERLAELEAELAARQAGGADVSGTSEGPDPQ